MAEVLYEDDRCIYCWGDPRLEERLVSGRLLLSTDGIRFVGEHHTLLWPRDAIISVDYVPTHPVDLTEIQQTQGIDAAQDIELALIENVAPQPALSLAVRDPEGVEPHGFDVRIMFRNEYYAKVFAKRTATTFGVPFKNPGIA